MPSFPRKWSALSGARQRSRRQSGARVMPKADLFAHLPRSSQKPSLEEHEEDRRALVTKVATLLIVGIVTVIVLALVRAVLTGQLLSSERQWSQSAAPLSPGVFQRFRNAASLGGSWVPSDDDDGNIPHPHAGGYLWLSSESHGHSSTPGVSFVDLAAKQPVTATLVRAPPPHGGGFFRPGKPRAFAPVSIHTRDRLRCVSPVAKRARRRPSAPPARRSSTESPSASRGSATHTSAWRASSRSGDPHRQRTFRPVLIRSRETHPDTLRSSATTPERLERVLRVRPAKRRGAHGRRRRCRGAKAQPSATDAAAPFHHPSCTYSSCSQALLPRPCTRPRTPGSALRSRLCCSQRLGRASLTWGVQRLRCVVNVRLTWGLLFRFRPARVQIWEALPECSTFFADKKKMKQCKARAFCSLFSLLGE